MRRNAAGGGCNVWLLFCQNDSTKCLCDTRTDYITWKWDRMLYTIHNLNKVSQLPPYMWSELLIKGKNDCSKKWNAYRSRKVSCCNIQWLIACKPALHSIMPNVRHRHHSTWFKDKKPLSPICRTPYWKRGTCSFPELLFKRHNSEVLPSKSRTLFLNTLPCKVNEQLNACEWITGILSRAHFEHNVIKIAVLPNSPK